MPIMEPCEKRGCGVHHSAGHEVDAVYMTVGGEPRAYMAYVGHSEEWAKKIAQAIDGVVIAAPILHDYRLRMSTDFPGKPFGRGDTVTIMPDA